MPGISAGSQRCDDAGLSVEGSDAHQSYEQIPSLFEKQVPGAVLAEDAFTTRAGVDCMQNYK